jgi:hypothetical protein
MQYFHERLMDQLVADRQAYLAELMAESQHRSAVVRRLGLMLIRLGETLRRESPSTGEMISLRQPRPSRSGVLS